MELLAPAGDFSCLVAAVQNGADAVYLGGRAFSARTAANAFAGDDLRRAVDYAHVRGAKVYLALNTLVRDGELGTFCDLAAEAYRTGVDALIVQDVGGAAQIRRDLPGMRLHASTQMTVRDMAGVKQAEALGFARTVLARELSKEAISAIAANTDSELEVFVHGALCMCYSGQCLMSSMIGGRSGNRGGCAQPCRLPYVLERDGRAVTQEGPLLSPKDLCLVEHLSELSDIGVHSLKIEGRLKSPEYVAMVTGVYRAALTDGVRESDIADMLSFYSRGGSCTGYFCGKPGGALIHRGDAPKVSADPALERRVRQTFAEGVQRRKTPVHLAAALHVGQPALLLLTAGEVTVCVEGAVVEAARERPMEEDRLREQLGKLGNTPFAVKSMEVTMDGNAILPVRELNALRRAGCEALEEALAGSRRRPMRPCAPAFPQALPWDGTHVLTAQVTTQAQFEAVSGRGLARIYVPWTLCGHIPEDETVVYALPAMLDDLTQARQVLAGKRVQVNNLGQLHAFAGWELYGGFRLNAMNSCTLSELGRLGVCGQVLSPELNVGQLGQIVSPIQTELMLYGRIPLMLTEHCVIGSETTCDCQTHAYALKDRKGERFPLLQDACRTTILNSKPLYAADRIQEMNKLKINAWNLYFTVENPKNCGKIVEDYQNAILGKEIPTPRAFTRGHLFRGVK